MQAYGEQASPDGSLGTHAGLVLLYAPTYDLFDPAYLLEGADLIIGRVPESGICIPEAAVSRQHARIHYQGGRWILTDLGGRNGTLVDGEFVHEITLEHLHEIRVGDVIFKFVEADAEGYARFRIDGSIVGASPEETVAHKAHLGDIVGGHQVARIASALERVARSPVSVILLGESGTGKEVFARFIHEMSGRKGALRAINCAAIPRELLESELFGYKRGAFSGADRDKIGLIRAADGGTLMLDEIGEMDPRLQAKLLRVLQNGEFQRLGGTETLTADVRIISATHRDLEAEVEVGRFREDLYYRMAVFTVHLPALRERSGDLPLLIQHFLREAAKREGKRIEGVDPLALELLKSYSYPGNVRELQNVIAYAVVSARGPVVAMSDLPASFLRTVAMERRKAEREAVTGASASGPAAALAPAALGLEASKRFPTLYEVERRHIQAAMTRAEGNKALAARLLGISRMTLYRKLEEVSGGVSLKETLDRESSD